jgi:hypothetical protein
MQIIMLDIDGVLVTRKSLKNGQSGVRAKADPRAVAQLNRVLKETGAQIVITSTWRLVMGPGRFQYLLRDEWGVQGCVIGTTPTCNAIKSGLAISLPRSAEIQAWLDLVRSSSVVTIEKFVIVDDDSDMGHLNKHLVRTELAVHLDLVGDRLSLGGLI